MNRFIRFVGVMNAAVWLGGVVFFTLAAGPALFSAEMASFLPHPYAARVAEVLVERLFAFQQWCAVIGLLHLLVEFLYSGRRASGLLVGLLAAVLMLNILGSLWLLPHMHALEQIRYATNTTAAQKGAAASAFGFWHGLSQLTNLGVLAFLIYYLANLTRDATLRPWQ